MFYLHSKGTSLKFWNTERDIQIGCYAVLVHLQRLIWDNTYMIHILPNLYGVQHFSTVPFDGSSITVLVGNYRAPYKNNRYSTVMFPGYPKASKLHNLSIHWNHQLAYLFSIISCWISTKVPTMWVYSSCDCVCVLLLTSEWNPLWNHNVFGFCMISVEFFTALYSTVLPYCTRPCKDVYLQWMSSTVRYCTTTLPVFYAPQLTTPPLCNILYTGM